MTQSRLNLHGEFPVSTAQFAQALPTAMARCRFGNWTIGDGFASAARVQEAPGGVLMRRENLQLVVEWQGTGDAACEVWWAVFDYTQGLQGAQNNTAALEFQSALRALVYSSPETAPPPHNPIIAPGADFDGRFTGILRDYSFCAPEPQLEDLLAGVLPLGIPTFAEGKQPASGPVLYLGNSRNGKPLLFKGVLISAPQNSGKTELILRWARAANAAGYNILLIDVKGNLRQKLTAEGWAGELLSFSTGPEACDHINFLAGYLDPDAGITPQATDRIKQLVAALLPSEGFLRQGGEQEFFYRNRVIWLTALVHLLLLRQLYHPWRFKDCRMVTEECSEGWENAREACPLESCARTADLGDLYELVTDEDLLAEVIEELRLAEAEMRDEGTPPPECGVDYWVREVALLLNPAKVVDGQRPDKQSYQEYTAGLKQALEPFARHGSLHDKIRDNGPGRLFSLEDLGAEPPADPVTILLSARAQDHANADTVLALSITRLQQLLFERMSLEEPRPILLLLDETRRIRGFRPNEYITFAREAKAGCVLVYQSLDQIGDERKIFEILENVGTQIYLDSLSGNTARYFLKILPRRARMVRIENTQVSPAGITRTFSTSKESADAYSLDDLYRLPAGDWPALVYLSDPPRRRAFLVDMDMDRLPKIEARDPNAIDTTLIATFGAPVCEISLLFDTTRVACTLTDGHVHVRNVEPGDQRPERDYNAGAGGWSLDGEWFAMGLADGRINVFATGNDRHWETHTDAVTALAWSPDSRLLASISSDNTLAVTEVESGRLEQLLHGAFTAVAMLASGAAVAADAQGIVRIFSPGSSSWEWQYAAGEAVRCFAVHPPSGLLAWAAGGRVYVRGPDADAVWLAMEQFCPVVSLCFHALGDWFAAGLENGQIVIIDTGQWQQARRLNAHQGAVRALAFAAAGTVLFSAGQDGNLLRIDLANSLAEGMSA